MANNVNDLERHVLWGWVNYGMFDGKKRDIEAFGRSRCRLCLGNSGVARKSRPRAKERGHPPPGPTFQQCRVWAWIRTGEKLKKS